jgi:hypothetical protein
LRQGEVRVPVEPFSAVRGASSLDRRAYRLLSCEAPVLHDGGPGVRFTAPRSSPGAFQPPGSSDRCAPRIPVPPVASPHRCLCSSNRTAYCFTERRHRCGAHAPGDRPARSQSIRPAARRSVPRTFLQSTGRSRRAAQNGRVSFRPDAVGLWQANLPEPPATGGASLPLSRRIFGTRTGCPHAAQRFSRVKEQCRDG